MVNIEISNIIDRWYNNSDGETIRELILNSFKKNEVVSISFKNIEGLNSSFINSAFIDLLEFYSFEYIKSHLKFVNGNKQIYEIIRKRFDYETTKKIS